jgi:hypothetical protein
LVDGNFCSHSQLLREQDKTHEACSLANTQHSSLEEIIAEYAKAVNEATEEQDIIGLSEVLAGHTAAELVSMILEAGDDLGAFVPICQPLDLPYLEHLNGKRLILCQGDSMYALERKNEEGVDGGAEQNSKIMSTLLTDTFGPDALNYADECRASIRIGGNMGDSSALCIALLQEIEDGLTPPNIRPSQPDWHVDQEKLMAEYRKIYFCGTGAFNDLVNQAGNAVPEQPILRVNAHGLLNHVKYLSRGRISCGKAKDWKLDPDFDRRAYALEHMVIAGKDPVNTVLESREDLSQFLATPMEHMIQLNPHRTLKKMSQRIKPKGKIDQWHKANTPENTTLFCQSLKAKHSLAVENSNLRRIVFVACSSGEARATRPPTLLFSAEEKLAIHDRRQVENRAEVIATAQSANPQVLRDLGVEQPEEMLQRACDTANIPVIQIGEVFEMKEREPHWPPMVGVEIVSNEDFLLTRFLP